VRYGAAWSLGYIRPRDATVITALTEATRTQDPVLQFMAKDALRQIQQEKDGKPCDPKEY